VRYENLPESELIGKASSQVTLFFLLIAAAGKQTATFTHIDRALGGPRSCRLMFQEAVPSYTETVALREPLNCAIATVELLDLAHSEARYTPQPQPQAEKGWEIRVAEADGKKFIIALAEWVLPDEDLESRVKVASKISDASV
jgi:hypothetical protein